MKAKPLITQFLAATLSILIFLSQCVFAHAAEVNFWTERSNAQLAIALPPVLKENHIGDSAWKLPAEYGSLRTVLRPTSASDNKRTVIHIQDVHQNPEAQSNISKTLKMLLDKNQVAMVALEGAFDQLQLNPFQTYPYPDVIQTVANSLLENKQLSGPLHAALTSPHATSVAFVGVDDQRHYDENVAAYLNASPRAEKAKKELTEKKQELVRKKETTLNTALRKFDFMTESYQQGQISLSAYAQMLLETEKFSGHHESIVHFLEAARLESAFDSNAVERERAQLISILSRKISPTEMTKFSNQTIAFRAGQLTHEQFYSNLQRLCDAHNIQLAQFPTMQRYLRYVTLSDNIDGKKLFQELRQTEKTVYAALERTPEEAALIEQSRALNLTDKLLDFSLTREEWDEYRQIPKTSDELKSFEAFYEEASLRDDDMANNFLKNRATTKADVCVLVTGGFHSSGIDEKLAKAGYTVMSFVPKISKVDLGSGSAYLSVFAQEKTPLEKLFAGEKLFLCPPQKNGLINAIPGILELTKFSHPDAVIDHLFKSLTRNLTTDSSAFALIFWKWVFLLIRHGRRFDINIADIGQLAGPHKQVMENIARLQAVEDKRLEYHNSRHRANNGEADTFRPSLAPYEIHLIGGPDNKVIDSATGQRAHAGDLSTVGMDGAVKQIFLARGYWEDDPHGAFQTLLHEASELGNWWRKVAELITAGKIRPADSTDTTLPTFRDWIATNEDTAKDLYDIYHNQAQRQHPSFKYDESVNFSDFEKIRARFSKNFQGRMVRANDELPQFATSEEHLALFRIAHAASLSATQRATVQNFLVEINSGLVYDIVEGRKKYILNAGMKGLWEAIIFFDYTLGTKLSTLANKMIPRAISAAIKQRRRRKQQSGLTDQFHYMAVAPSTIDPLLTPMVIELLDYVGRWGQVTLKMRFGIGTTPEGRTYSNRELGRLLDRCATRIDQIQQSAMDHIRNSRQEKGAIESSRSHLDVMLVENGVNLDNPVFKEILALEEIFHLTDDPDAKSRIVRLKDLDEIRIAKEIRKWLETLVQIDSDYFGISFSKALLRDRFFILNQMAFALSQVMFALPLTFPSITLKWKDRATNDTHTGTLRQFSNFSYQITVDAETHRNAKEFPKFVEAQTVAWAKIFVIDLRKMLQTNATAFSTFWITKYILNRLFPSYFGGRDTDDKTLRRIAIHRVSWWLEAIATIGIFIVSMAITQDFAASVFRACFFFAAIHANGVYRKKINTEKLEESSEFVFTPFKNARERIETLLFMFGLALLFYLPFFIAYGLSGPTAFPWRIVTIAWALGAHWGYNFGLWPGAPLIQYDSNRAMQAPQPKHIAAVIDTLLGTEIVENINELDGRLNEPQINDSTGNNAKYGLFLLSLFFLGLSAALGCSSIDLQATTMMLPLMGMLAIDSFNTNEGLEKYLIDLFHRLTGTKGIMVPEDPRTMLYLFPSYSGQYLLEKILLSDLPTIYMPEWGSYLEIHMRGKNPPLIFSPDHDDCISVDFRAEVNEHGIQREIIGHAHIQTWGRRGRGGLAYEQFLFMLDRLKNYSHPRIVVSLSHSLIGFPAGAEKTVRREAKKRGVDVLAVTRRSAGQKQNNEFADSLNSKDHSIHFNHDDNIINSISVVPWDISKQPLILIDKRSHAASLTRQAA